MILGPKNQKVTSVFSRDFFLSLIFFVIIFMHSKKISKEMKKKKGKTDVIFGFLDLKSVDKIFQELKISIFKENLKSKCGQNLDRPKILFVIKLMLIFSKYGLMGIPNGCAPFDFSKLMNKAGAN